jgi:transcriptional regulator with XRE-family HTH domain
MTTLAVPTHDETSLLEIGARVREARLAAGLSQRELGERLGVTLWTVEQMEAGKADPAAHAGRLAAITGRPEDWFAADAPPARPGAPEDAPASATATGPAYGRWIVLGTLVALVVIRFFTEVYHLLPGGLNFVDVPLLAVVAFAALVFPVRDGRITGGLRQAGPVLLFVAICTASLLANPGRIATGPVLLFLYGFLGPLGFAYGAYRLWPAGNARVLSRALFGLALVQFAVVLAVDSRRFAASDGNPDTIGGTFGANPYQLVFFLILVVALCAGIATFERGTLAARLAPFVVAASFLVIFLAQYRALLISTLVSLIVLGLMLAATRTRGLLFGVFAIAAFVVALGYVADRYPRTKFATTIDAFSSDPAYFAKARFGAFGDIGNVYIDVPHSLAVGTGPGTYSSRAWRTFADITTGETEVVTGTIRRVTGGSKYRTDVSEKYVVPRLVDAEAELGSKALTSPLSSYGSLLAEVGILGFAVLIGIYLAAFSRSIRMALTVMRRPRAIDPLPGLLLASTVGLLLLLQMALLENWLEVTRVTVPAWIVFAVATKEFQARMAEERASA